MLRKLTWLLVLKAGIAFAIEPAQVRTDAPRFVGALSCKSSSCHGGAGEKHDQFQVWSEQDFHSRAYAILTTPRSARMAESLQLSSATENARCTMCHAPFQQIPKSRLASAIQPQEAVSCETCHGAAEPWLRGHTRKDWTAAMRVAAGMRQLKDLYVRANTCVACHQNIDADVLDAGHPELAFELNQQSIAEPKHWQDAKSNSSIWLVGQAVALREVSWRLAQSPASDSRNLAQFESLTWLLAQVTAFDPTLPKIESPQPTASYAAIEEEADKLARVASESERPAGFANSLRRTLAANAFSQDKPADFLFRRANRLVLALKALSENDQPAELATLSAAAKTPSNFDPKQFAQLLTEYSQTLAHN